MTKFGLFLSIWVAVTISSTGRGDDGETVRLGHYGSMSGSKAAYGTSNDQGIRLAVEQANRAGGVLGRKVELFTEDDQSNPDEVIPAILSILDRKKVDVVLGEVSSTLTLIGAPLCQDRGVPMVTPSSVAAAITQKGDMIFRVCFIDIYQGRAAAVFAIRHLHSRRAALLVDQSNDYSLGFARSFRELYEAMGGRIVVERKYREGDKDFKSQLAAIGDARPDLIAIPAMYPDVPGIAKQARSLGLTTPLLGGDGWDSIETARNGGSAVDGSYFITQYAPDQPDAPVQAFQTAYEKRFGEAPDVIAALAYDAARLVLDAIQRAGGTDHRKVRDAIAETRNFAGVTGLITMGPDRNPAKSAMIVQIRDASFHLFQIVEPSAIAEALGRRKVATSNEAVRSAPGLR